MRKLWKRIVYWVAGDIDYTESQLSNLDRWDGRRSRL